MVACCLQPVGEGLDAGSPNAVTDAGACAFVDAGWKVEVLGGNLAGPWFEDADAGIFLDALGVALGQDGGLFISSVLDAQIVSLEPLASIMQLPPLSWPVALAVLPDSSFAVLCTGELDSSGGGVAIVAPDGTTRLKVPILGNRFGPSGTIAWGRDHSLYAVVDGNADVYVVHLDGTYADVPLQSSAPASLAATPDGGILLAVGCQVLEFDPASGSTTVVAGQAARCQVVDGNGTSAAFGGPIAMAFAPSGNLYVLDPDYSSGSLAVRRMTPDGTVETVASFPPCAQPSPLGINPSQIAVSSSGIYFANTEWIGELVPPAGSL